MARFAFLIPLACIGLLYTTAQAASARLPVWRDNVTLWSATVKTCDQSAYCHAQLGLSLIQAGEVQRGGRELEHTVAIRAAPRYMQNLGDALTFNARNYDAAVRIYKYALEVSKWAEEPDLRGFSQADTKAGIARAYILAGNLVEARRALNQALTEHGRTRNLLMVLALLEYKNGNVERAADAFHEAFPDTITPTDAAKGITSYWGDRQAAEQFLLETRAG
jgi:tetratricopeptide (TPR) repeat protein